MKRRMKRRIDEPPSGTHIRTIERLIQKSIDMKLALRLAIAALILAPATVLADPQFSANDIIQHFLKSQGAAAASAPQGTVQRPAAGADAPLVLPLTGARRSVTIGAARTEGFDLLITFELGSATLTRQARQNLDTFARALSTASLAAYRFEVQGHTDASGQASSNQSLSEQRARSVVKYLVARGIHGQRLVARGYGESRPLMPDPGDPRNRRVETRRIP